MPQPYPKQESLSRASNQQNSPIFLNKNFGFKILYLEENVFCFLLFLATVIGFSVMFASIFSVSFFTFVVYAIHTPYKLWFPIGMFCPVFSLLSQPAFQLPQKCPFLPAWT
jgi:hypothetical protein